jgi:hypothetical protein
MDKGNMWLHGDWSRVKHYAIHFSLKIERVNWEGQVFTPFSET